MSEIGNVFVLVALRRNTKVVRVQYVRGRIGIAHTKAECGCWKE